MDVALIEALRQAKLEPGTYRCRVNGHEVVIEVQPSRPAEAQPTAEELPPLPLADPVTIDESGIMMDPWVELPGPSGGIILESHLGEPELPDVPEIPPYDEAEEAL